MLYKNTLIKIKKSFGRYISILIIVLVGVGFYAGLSSTVPDMISVADQYYKDQNLMSFKIVSTLGLTDDDRNALKNLIGVDSVVPSYSLDVLNKDKAIRVHAIETVNTVKLMDGRLPTSDTECVADSKIYKIGDQIKITSDVNKKMKSTEFTVVGTTQSALYLAGDYGNTTIGDGKLSSFIFINKDNFTVDAYTEIYIIATGAKNAKAYSKKYDEITAKVNDQLIKIKPVRENARYREIYNKAKKVIAKNETKLNNEKSIAQKKLDHAKIELDSNAKKLQRGKTELAKNETDLQKNVDKQNAEFDTAKAKITSGWAEINSTLNQSGIKKDEINTKIDELGTSIEAMKTQLNSLDKGSQEYIQLSATIAEYSANYNGLLKLKRSIDTLTVKETELNNGIKTFNSKIAKAKKEIEKAKNEIAINEKKLNDGYDEYNKNLKEFNTKMADAEAKIANAKRDISDIEHPKWMIFDRGAAAGYSELKSTIDIITTVAVVFPFLFILIVVLITSNSMTRMIEEERSELGTLTSLGYKDKNIISTYLLYVLSASGVGAIAGFFIGCSIIPHIIYSAFKNSAFHFILPPMRIQYDVVMLSTLLAVTLVFMTFVTLTSCHQELKHKPAALLRPVPPKNGKSIFLEKIGFIWNHLSFIWKVTMRNMFRYKKRALMTIFGVGCCVAILLVGFGLRDSMNGVAEKQYSEIFQYNSQIILKDEVKSINGDLKNILVKEQIKNPVLILQAAVKCESNNESFNAFSIVPENEDTFYSYYNLKSIEKKANATLHDSGVVITQRLAKALGAAKGDTISIKDADNNVYKVAVSDIAANYIGNYIYMNKNVYDNTFGKTTNYNTIVSDYSADIDKEVLAQHLIDSEFVVNTIFSDDVIQRANDGNDSLNSIIILLIVVASLLAIIVLYNLTTINISERKREIATLKVLGFRDGETNSYIYREAVILTLIGIGVGFVLGVCLHGFVIEIMGRTDTAFVKSIHILSYIWACLITMLFSVIMQIITYFKLKTIDMIESLKSVE